MTDYQSPHYWVKYDPSNDTERNTRRAAEASSEMNERIGVLVDAMHEQLAIAKQAQADAERSERFTRRTAIISLIVSGASLIAAVAAIIVSVVVAGA